MQTLEGFRLSPQQKYLWLLQQDSLAYRASCAIQIEGNLNVEALKAALNQIVDRHESLRTTFHRQPGIKIPSSHSGEWNPILESSQSKGIKFQEQSAYIEQLLQEAEAFISNLNPNLYCLHLY
jgi:NRPS condensation-like uncharacterized protein